MALPTAKEPSLGLISRIVIIVLSEKVVFAPPAIRKRLLDAALCCPIIEDDALRGKPLDGPVATQLVPSAGKRHQTYSWNHAHRNWLRHTLHILSSHGKSNWQAYKGSLPAKVPIWHLCGPSERIPDRHLELTICDLRQAPRGF